MPILKGGAKYRNRRVWTMLGFVRSFFVPGTRVKEIKRIRILGAGNEGTTYEVDVVLDRYGKQRTVRMVEKQLKRAPYLDFHPIRNFGAQFRIMNNLMTLNQKKRLGLRIVPTIRLLKGNKTRGLSSLITTKLNLLNPITLSTLERNQFDQDQVRQGVILNREGYMTGADSFFPQRDPKTNQVVAVIGDFGTIKKWG